MLTKFWQCEGLKPNFKHRKQSSIIKIITAIFLLLSASFSVSEVGLKEETETHW